LLKRKVYVLDVTALSTLPSSARVESPVRLVVRNIRHHFMIPTGNKKQRQLKLRVVKVKYRRLMEGKMVAKSPMLVTPFVM